jgi:flagellar biosynthesis GTPase FlhF
MKRVYRGATLEDLLPQIREELGDDAVITHQREGIVGGIGGFFGKRCVEVEACAAQWLGIDVDGTSAVRGVPTGFVSDAYAQPDEDELLAEVAANPVIRQLIGQSTPFAEHLDAAFDDLGEADFEVEVAPAEPAPPSPAQPDDRSDAGLPSPSDDGTDLLAAGARDALAAAGLSLRLADAVVEEAVHHLRPFALEEAFTTQVRRALGRRIRVEHGFAGDRRTIVLVGASGGGRTLAAARLARGYAQAGTFRVAVLDLASEDGSERLRGLLAGTDVELRAASTQVEAAQHAYELSGPRRILVIDTPPLSAGAPESAEALTALLAALAPDEIHAVVPATTDVGATERMLDTAARSGLRVDRLLLSRLDEVPRPGGVVGLAVERGLAVSFVATGREPERGLRPADPVLLAGLLVA